MAASKPTFLLVPGAWHPVSCYDTLLQELSNAGYTSESVDLPSLDPSGDPSASTCANDAQVVRQKLLSMIRHGKQVVVVAHSYGGIPGGCGAHGLLTSAGETGGVIGLVYMSAFVAPEGSSLLELFGGKFPPYVQENDPSEGLARIVSTRETIFNDLDETLAENIEKMLRPHSMRAFDSPVPVSAWVDPAFQGRLAFVRCILDNALPMSFQDMSMQRSGAEWTVKDIEAGHSAFVSKPKEVVEILTGLAADFSPE